MGFISMRLLLGGRRICWWSFEVDWWVSWWSKDKLKSEKSSFRSDLFNHETGWLTATEHLFEDERFSIIGIIISRLNTVPVKSGLDGLIYSLSKEMSKKPR